MPKELQQADDLGADLAVIDTPPRPRAFDLDAVRTTAELAAASKKPAFLIFMAGPRRAPLIYKDAGQLV